MPALALGLPPLAAQAAPALAPRDPKSIADRFLTDEWMQTGIPHRIEEAKQASWFHVPAELANLILWGGVIVGAVLIAYALRDALPGWDRSRKLEADAEAATFAKAEQKLDGAKREADELAGEGRYGEAMHLLLLRAVAELRDKLKLTIADSLTAREIERRAPLEASGKGAFARMVRAVEQVLFGRADADEAAFRACRGDFEAFAESLAPGRRA